MLWIGLILLPQDGSRKAPTTALYRIVNQLDTALTVYMEQGYKSIGPYITVDDTRSPAVPEITNGYYFFLDRHSQSTDPHDDTNVLSRASFNLTIAIYDCGIR